MRPRVLLTTTLLGLPLMVGGWLWLTLLSPFLYERPAHLEPIAEGPHAVYVYGTLRVPVVRWIVIGDEVETRPASLEGWRRTGLDLEPAPGERVPGEVLIVDAEELARLDRYERLGIRYERVRHTLADGSEAWVYRRLPDEARTSSP
ncbi:gamma-glutamylcyclotransferase family protein [Halomonas marinisediminis]|uniref:Gamma-glutamylcyclotransferase n=1 Tax=Halomonas marinisediminis TaxID=2546095 RepID=A0ABY2DAZ6_9GAMM|nr:gamma-glutamylcyclotransferase family protein [Halomonas marinisediminis]TDB05498.1 gamma-glutamylcyclotransferase [Halomonas marinisediminis]